MDFFTGKWDLGIVLHEVWDLDNIGAGKWGTYYIQDPLKVYGHGKGGGGSSCGCSFFIRITLND